MVSPFMSVIAEVSTSATMRRPATGCL
jgi:hypothetical protein